MRFDSIKVRGFGPFDSEITLDLREQEGRVVAVTGANGAGKSTLLELLAGALYRRMPTRGTLKDLATSRDAYVEVGLQNGAPWTVRQRVDAVSGKGEAEVLDGEGRAVLGSTKVKEADAWVADHLPSADVLYASAFGAQGSQGFLDLDPTARKRVILTTLGHTHLEQLAKAAGERARAAKVELDTLLARIADERERGGDHEAATARLDLAKEEVAQATEALKVARDALFEVQADAELARQANAKREEQETKRRELAEQLRKAKAHRDELAERVRNNEALGAQADAIRQATADVERLQGEIADVETKRQELDRQCRDAIAKAGQAESLAKAAREAEERARRTAQRLRERLADREAMERQAEELPAREDAVAAAQKALDEAKAEVQRLEALRLEGKDRRIFDLRAGLAWIAEEPSSDGIAESTLAQDDALAEELASAPEAIKAAQLREREARADHESANREALAARAAAETLQELHKVAAELEEAEAAVSSYANEAAEQEAEAKIQREAATDAKAALRNLQPDVNLLQRSLGDAQKSARLLAKLEVSKARLEELRPQHEAVEAAIGQLEEQLTALGTSTPPVAIPTTTEQEHAVKEAEPRLRSAEAAVAVREAEVSQAKASAERLARLAVERKQLEEGLADWRLLERDLGRDGVQALEADAAGPELTELANDLLSTCGTRFRVRVETVRNKKSGKGEREGCWVMVQDCVTGREDDAKTFSGGERVVVAEAINLAISMLGVRHAGLSKPTLVRDESGAALDGDNGRAYVEMLRRAASLVGAHKVLLVTHSEELAEMADSRITISNGRLEVAA